MDKHKGAFDLVILVNKHPSNYVHVASNPRKCSFDHDAILLQTLFNLCCTMKGGDFLALLSFIYLWRLDTLFLYLVFDQVGHTFPHGNARLTSF